MHQTQIKEIIGCLPKGRTLFSYFKDRYALMLLTHFIGSGKPMREIKQSWNQTSRPGKNLVLQLRDCFQKNLLRALTWRAYIPAPE